jgi:Zn-dependent protease with chaperone function
MDTDHTTTQAPPSAAAGTDGPVIVERWPTEIPLLALVLACALSVWLVLVISIFGILYAVMLGAFFFVAHVTFVAVIRGSAVKLGPDQLPDLYHRVQALGRRAGLDRVPDAYLMQADGSLNAFATRFFRSNLIVLFTDLVDACGDDQGARDMIIGHEIGHVRAGHLRWHGLLLPGMLIPFVGAAYSRAREYTCDRYGAALCGDREAAQRGLTILAAGGRFVTRVNLQAYIAQQDDLSTGWMTIGKWMSGYPPLTARIEALQPGGQAQRSVSGPLRAFGILGAIVAVPVGIAALVAAVLGWAGVRNVLDARGATSARAAAATADETARVNSDLSALQALVLEYHQRHGAVPADRDALFAAWKERHPDLPVPTDVFGNEPYRYVSDPDGGVLIYSVGPDREEATVDDIDRQVDIPITAGPGVQ